VDTCHIGNYFLQTTPPKAKGGIREVSLKGRTGVFILILLEKWDVEIRYIDIYINCHHLLFCYDIGK
jgi:hypothetical protein